MTKHWPVNLKVLSASPAVRRKPPHYLTTHQLQGAEFPGASNQNLGRSASCSYSGTGRSGVHQDPQQSNMLSSTD